jgi:CelD/BcsL family acetyltransferase involved in cellulose biosynthesis
MGTTVQASTPLADLPIRGRRTYLSREVTRPEELEVLLAEWQDLAEHAAEPNVFYEPWMVLPALDAYGGDRDLRFLFLFEERRDGPPLLCGFFPIERVPHFRGLPIPCFRLWAYVHCFLGTPLVRAGRVRSVIAAFLRWLRDRSAEHLLLEMPYCSADGPVHGALVARGGAGVGRMVARSWERALFEPRSSGEAYLEEAMRTKKSKEVRRLWRRLAERGRLEIEVLSPGTGAAASPEMARTWGEEFLRLEASGWKGRGGTALLCRASDREFFRRVIAGAHERGRLMMLALRLDGRAIAMKCNLLAGDGGFAFKIAYDEEYGGLSPGFLLEIETIRHLHDCPAVRWLDSCAVPDHPMADRLWLDRRAMQSIQLATGDPAGRLVVPVFSVARRLAERTAVPSPSRRVDREPSAGDRSRGARPELRP